MQRTPEETGRASWQLLVVYRAKGGAKFDDALEQGIIDAVGQAPITCYSGRGERTLGFAFTAREAADAAGARLEAAKLGDLLAQVEGPFEE